MNPRVVLQVGWLAIAALILAANTSSFIAGSFFVYGARTTDTADVKSPAASRAERHGESINPITNTATDPPQRRNDVTPRLVKDSIRLLAEVKVPHSWFTAFYHFAVLVTVFWFSQLLTRSPVQEQTPLVVPGSDKGSMAVIFTVISQPWTWMYELSLGTLKSHTSTGAGTSVYTSMSIPQVLFTGACFFAQVSRRLYECLYVFTTPTKAQMWIGHFLVGFAFYAAMSVSIWIEGGRELLPINLPLAYAVISKTWLRTGEIVEEKYNADSILAEIARQWHAPLDLTLELPSTTQLLGFLIFVAAFCAQHLVHLHLSQLKAVASSSSRPTHSATRASSYSMPTHWLFNYVLTPHYTAEILIYVGLSLVAAPKGQVVNRTLFCAVVWIGITLGVTAAGTRSWYLRVFGADKVGDRMRMIPFVY